MRLLYSVALPANKCQANVHLASSPGGVIPFDHENLRFRGRDSCSCTLTDSPQDVGCEVTDSLRVVAIRDAATMLLAEYEVVFESSMALYEEETVWLTATSRASSTSVRHTGSDDAGLGLFAEDDVPAGVLLGEYGGVLTIDSPASIAANSAYAVAYPALAPDGRACAVDASAQGSLLRRINHASGQQANCAFVVGWYTRPGQEPFPVRTVSDAQCLGLPRIFMMTIRDVAAGEQLLADYGAEYWRKAGVQPIQLATSTV